MTIPRVSTIKRGGSRFYIDPADASRKLPGVTSVLGMLPKEFLRYWAAKEVATTAVEELGTVVQMVLRDPEAAIDHLKKAPDRNTRKAADTGTAAHDLFERLARGEKLGRVHPDLEPYVRHFSEFCDVVQPRFLHLEETVWSDTYGYAGSFDWVAEIGGETVWGDNKTTRSGIHAEVGLQLSAYAAADCIISPEGDRLPIPQSEIGAVFHVRPEGWSLTPVRADRKLFEDYFLPLLRVLEYEREGKATIIGRSAFSGPSENTAPTPKRRAPRATAKPSAASPRVARPAATPAPEVSE